MSVQARTTRTMTLSEAKNSFSSLVNEVSRGQTRILVQDAESTVAALVSADDLRRLEQLDLDWEEGTRALERFGQAFADIPTEEAEAENSRIIADIRRQDRIDAERKPA